MSAIAHRRAAFAAVLANYHNSFANATEGHQHSAEFISRLVRAGAGSDIVEAAKSDPRLTSTDTGAIAIGLAKQVMTNERASKSFLDVEIAEGAFLVTFDADVKPELAAGLISSTGPVAQFCKPGDQLAEGLVADVLILAVEPTQEVAEGYLAEAMADSLMESEVEIDEAGKPKLGTGARFAKLAKSVHSKALAAYIGRKKYGAKKMGELSHHESVAESADDGYENPDHPHFSALAKVPKYNGPVNTFTAHGGGNRMHAFMRSGGKVTKDRAAHLAGHHAAKAAEHDKAWGETADDAAHAKFGRPFEFGDYKTSGAGNEEFSDEHKDKLRHHAQLSGKHRALATMFGHAAKYSKMKEAIEVEGDDIDEAKPALDRARAASDAAVARAKSKRHVKEAAATLFAYAYGVDYATLSKIDESARGDRALAHMMRVFGGGTKTETGVSKFDAILAKALAARKLHEGADAWAGTVDDFAFDLFEAYGNADDLAEATIDDNGVGKVIEAQDERLRGIARIALMGAGVVSPAVSESFEALVAHIKAVTGKKPKQS